MQWKLNLDFKYIDSATGINNSCINNIDHLRNYYTGDLVEIFRRDIIYLSVKFNFQSCLRHPLHQTNTFWVDRYAFKNSIKIVQCSLIWIQFYYTINEQTTSHILYIQNYKCSSSLSYFYSFNNNKK